METITEILSKCKRAVLGELFVPLIIVLVGFSAFGLGRLSVDGQTAAPVRITSGGEEQRETQVATANESLASGTVVGSKNSDKYHFPWCSGAQRIAERNLVTFESITAARAAGYSPAGNCQGLE